MSRTRKYWHETIGYNYRLTNIQAAIGVAQVEQFETFLRKRGEIAETYDAILQHDAHLELPRHAAWARRVNWLYTVLLEEGIDRDRVILDLKERGIDARPAFTPIHLMPPYAVAERFPVAESIGRRGLSLPSSASLSRADIEQVCSVLRKRLAECSSTR